MITITDAQKANYDAWYLDVHSKLAELDLEPSKMQYAVAAAAFHIRNNVNRQIWQQPPGTGKTRTLLCLIFLMANHGDGNDIVVRFSNKILLEQDKRAFLDMQSYVERKAKVHLNVGFHNAGRKNGANYVELYDEVDSLGLEDGKFDVHNETVANIIGLTATPIKDGLVTLEKQLLNHIGFNIKDSHIPPMSGNLTDF